MLVIDKTEKFYHRSIHRATKINVRGYGLLKDMIT